MGVEVRRDSRISGAGTFFQKPAMPLDSLIFKSCAIFVTMASRKPIYCR